MIHMLQLDCGHTRDIDRLIDIGVGHIRYCPTCKIDRIITAILPNASPRRPRAVIDSLLSCVLQMMKDVQLIDQTGDTWENILARAKVRVYDDLDAVAGGPPPPPVDYQSEYFKLFNNVVLVCQILGIDTIAAVPTVGNIDMHYVTQEATALIARIRDLQHFVKPPAGAHWGADWNSVVYKVEHLVKP